MQITGGFVFSGGMILTKPPPITGIPVSGDANVSLGTTVEWASNTWLYLAEGQANVRSSTYDTVNYDTNNGLWQLFYAHQSIRLPVSSGSITPSGGGARWSTIVRQSGVNNPQLYGAISGQNANLTDFKSNTDTALSSVISLTYAANTLWQGNVTTSFTVPANRYFALNFLGGPFYRNFKKTANNYTAVYAGNAIFTVINTVFVGAWPSGAGRGIPTQLNGNTSGFYKLTSNIFVSAVKFEIV